jgi:biopolymer transport protein ExbB
MNISASLGRRTVAYLGVLAVLLAVAARMDGLRRAGAAEAGPSGDAARDAPADPARLAAAEEAAKEMLAAPSSAQKPAAQPDAPYEIPGINLWQLYLDGGILMVPITGMSFIVVLFGLERALALRAMKVLPPLLIQGLGQLTKQPGGFDPRKAYKLCQRHPSAAANVVRAVLLKTGRPHSELEQTVRDAAEREAAKLYRNVRWLNLSAGVTPLMGLLGTVQGMIMAFYVTANLPTGVNKAQSLAQGIYVALVTTFGGLCVAIPAAMLSHFFEGRIQRLFGELDETLLGLMPQLERFEGKVRVNKEQLDHAEAPAGPPPAARREPAA